MKDYMKVKITEIACNFAVNSLRPKKFSGNYQKKRTSSAKDIWQSPYLTRFYAISKAANLNYRPISLSYRPKILQQGESRTKYLSDIFSETFKGKLGYQSTSSSRVVLNKIEDHNYVFQTSYFLQFFTWRAMSMNSFFSKKYCRLLPE